MPSCCPKPESESSQLRERQIWALKIVLVLNLIMFAVEMSAGWITRSTSLMADSLDMLGDALAYGISLYVVARSARWKAGAALIKGAIMAAFGFIVLLEAGHKMIHPVIPQAAVMGFIGFLALTVNATCMGLLWRHRTEDINMHSVWLCSRNDIFANLSVLVAALLVKLTGSHWPDLIVGLGIAALFLYSAWHVMQRASRNLSGQP